MSLASNRVEASEDGHRGTVRFIGPLDASATEYVGIEWDIPSRGKHSGNHPKTAAPLFSVKRPGSASFVKCASGKVLVARSFLEAVREKYLDGGDGSRLVPGLENEKSSGLKARNVGQDVEVEMVGWEKMRKKVSALSDIKIMGLAGMQVGWVTPVTNHFRQSYTPANIPPNSDYIRDQSASAIISTCPLVADLDLSRNLFDSWHQIAFITSQLPNLRSLRLNSNRLTIDMTQWNVISTGFLNIRNLALNNTLIQWKDVEKIAKCMPNLTELYIGFNQLTTFDSNDSKNDQNTVTQTYLSLTPLFPNLQVFHADQNLLTSWSDITSLISRQMPMLKWLNLSNNQLQEITPGGVLNTLETLNISGNNIQSYVCIHALNKFENLVDIRVRDNPVFSIVPPTALDISNVSTGAAHQGVYSNSDVSTHHISKNDELTARLSRAQRINGKHISPRDRADAEIYYLGKVAYWIQTLKASNAGTGLSGLNVETKINEMIATFHPRFHELVSLYGMPEIAPTNFTSNALKDRLVEIQFVLVGPDNEKVLKKVYKKVPLTLTVRALKALVGRVLGVSGKVSWMKGVLKCADTVNRNESLIGTYSVELEEEMREIGYYEFVAGDEIHVGVNASL